MHDFSVSGQGYYFVIKHFDHFFVFINQTKVVIGLILNA